MTLETNRYTGTEIEHLRRLGRLKATSRGSKWTDVDMSEMKAFVRIVLLMGYARLPSYDLYWSNSFLVQIPGFRKTMSRDRLLAILTFFHLSDNSIVLPYDHPNHDRLYNIRNFVDLLIPLWQGAYYPGRELSVDETLIAFKGRTAFMQYKPKKPHKWGLNAWTLAEPSRYVFNWDLYTGKRGNQTEHGLTFRVVTELWRPIYRKGHHIYMDNYFSRAALSQNLSKIILVHVELFG